MSGTILDSPLVMNSSMLRQFLIILCLTLGSTYEANAEVFFTLDEARQALWKDTPMHSVPITLTKSQVDAIEKHSKIRVLTNKVNAWKTSTGGWFIVDQVIGKHEMIDVAVAINRTGKIKGLKIMTYNESYGSEVRNPKWLSQFHGRDNTIHLKLDEQIDNITGATLSCRHITDGVNRWAHTWDIVLRHL